MTQFTLRHGQRNRLAFYVSIIGLLGGLFGMLPRARAVAPVPPANPKSPVRMSIVPTRQIYGNREGLMMRIVFKAVRRTKLCLEKDILSQMQFNVRKGGAPKPLAPLVVRDTRVLFDQPMRIRWLEPGEELIFRTNLRRYRFAEEDSWKPGEYGVTGSFSLCEQNESEDYDPAGREITLPADSPAWFMIMS